VFPHRLSEVTVDEIRQVIETEVPESLDFELKRTLSAKKGDDPWVAGTDRIGEEARDVLAAEMCAFANTLGGTLIVGIDEDTETKRAKGPIVPLPRCKELAERLHQSIGARIEPKVPMFECEGVITEADGSSGVVIMRTLESYLAPHRHTQDRHFYIRRNDRAEPMSVLEVQEQTRQKARSAEDAERAFRESSENFFSWIPERRRRSHPRNGVEGAYHTYAETGQVWIGLWTMRLTARPFAPLMIPNLPKQPWLAGIEAGTFSGHGELKKFWWDDMKVLRTWKPRLRAVEREFQGPHSFGVDRIHSNGLVERFVRLEDAEEKQRPKYLSLNITQVMWNLACVLETVSTVRARSSRPTQHFALEIEFMTSDPLLIYGYASPPRAVIQADTVTFPRYEIGPQETFDDVLMTFDTDLWNLGGHHPAWKLGVHWPQPKVG
jgi:Putative DNA-binding domain